jgi:alanine racemase
MSSLLGYGQRPIQLEVSTARLRDNLRALRQIQPNQLVWAVVKARGYGHGLDAVVQGFADADGLALLEIDELRQVRSLGWKKPVLLLEGLFNEAGLREAAELQADLVVHCKEQLQWLLSNSSHAQGYRQGAGRVWIKLNTGMNRLGFNACSSSASNSVETLADDLAKLRTSLGPGRLGFMMHFAQAESRSESYQALSLFQKALALLDHRPDIEPISLANSAAILSQPLACSGWLRPGILLYGSSPFQWQASSDDAQSLGQSMPETLRLASRLTTRLLSIQELAVGDGVGYGLRYRATKPMRIGVAAIGYADGFPRTAPDGTPMVIHGKRCPIVGQVSMDLITLDLSQQPQAEVGSLVEVWGDHLGVDELAACLGTLGYELLTCLTPRVSRRLVDPVSIER